MLTSSQYTASIQRTNDPAARRKASSAVVHLHHVWKPCGALSSERVCNVRMMRLFFLLFFLTDETDASTCDRISTTSCPWMKLVAEDAVGSIATTRSTEEIEGALLAVKPRSPGEVMPFNSDTRPYVALQVSGCPTLPALFIG